MSLRKSVNIATSLDGFIARKNNAIDWLDKANEMVPDGEDCGFSEFMSTVDCMAMGSGTFNKLLSFDLAPDQWPYGNAKILVLSRGDIEIPQHLRDRVEHTSEGVEQIVDRLEQEGYKHLYIDGGVTIQRFLAARKVDDINITIIPIIIGEGKPLFSNKIFSLNEDIELRLTNTKQFEFGFCNITYNVINN